MTRSWNQYVVMSLSGCVLIAGCVTAFLIAQGKSAYLPSVLHQAIAQIDSTRLISPPPNNVRVTPLATTPEVLPAPDDLHAAGASGDAMALIAETPPDPSSLQANYTGEKFEPLYGCYLGAYLDSAYNLEGMKGLNNAPLSREEAFGAEIGKPIASVFNYVGYGQPFPMDWAKRVAALGIAPHIAMEPNDGLDVVKDDAYLQQFARDAAACGAPIFLRFASEMNGTWVIYNKDPKQYVEKFRLVHDVMARYAPNVAMLWCVFTDPIRNIPNYYPGDEYVDWVGVNIYNVFYHDNDPKVPGWQEHPVELLDYVYTHYAARKPIAIAEYGATHYDTVDNAPRPDFASAKLAQLLTALPILYPRVKLLDFFECNNVKYGPPGRRLNDYALTDDTTVLQTARLGIASDYYLSKVVTDRQTTLPTMIPTRVTEGTVMHGSVFLSAWLKSNVYQPTVIFSVDGQDINSSKIPGDYRATLDTTKYPPGPHTLRIAAYDPNSHPKGKQIARLDVKVNILALPSF